MPARVNLAVILVATSVLVCETAAQTADTPKQQPSAQTYALKGQCQQLLVQDEDHTKDCIGALINTVWPDLRSGFYFVTEGGLAVTFSGIGSSQVHPDPNVAVQAIDAIIISLPPTKLPQKIQAVGTCRFENPTRGWSAPVECFAETSSGRYEAKFRSNGKPPLVANLPAPSMDEVKELFDKAKR